MERENIIEIAIKAWSMTSKRTPFRGWFEDNAEWFEAFAKLVAAQATAKEREACAKVCENLPAALEEFDALGRAADAIRARGQT